jgi:hypothetical protein
MATVAGMDGLAAAAFRQLREFGERYRGVLGARPFLKGLRTMLQRQVRLLRSVRRPPMSVLALVAGDIRVWCLPKQ